MIKMKVFSDFSCPYCYLGLGLINRLIEDGIELDVEWIPFELDPNAALGETDLFTVYPEKYVVGAINKLSRLGEEVNVKYNNINSKFNTRRAHLAGYYAKEHNMYAEYSKAVFKAYFEDVLNVADVDVLNQIAENIGLDITEMNESIDSGKYDSRLAEDLKLGKNYSISSIPTFIINDEFRMSGVREYRAFKEEIMENIS